MTWWLIITKEIQPVLLYSNNEKMCIYQNKKKENNQSVGSLLSLLLTELVCDGVLDGRAGAFVDDRIPERDLQEATDHQYQVGRVTQGNRNAPIILRCRTEHNTEVSQSLLDRFTVKWSHCFLLYKTFVEQI